MEKVQNACHSVAQMKHCEWFPLGAIADTKLQAEPSDLVEV